MDTLRRLLHRAIAINRATDDYKRKDLLDRTPSVYKTIGKRTFRYASGVWSDEAVKAGMKEIKIKAISEAYFELLTLRPELKKVLALGQKIVVVINGHKVVIGEAGQEELDAASKKQLKP